MANTIQHYTKPVVINKDECDKEHLYSVTNLAAEYRAMNDLLENPNAFLLWRILAMNQNHYSFPFSPAIIMSKVGISRTTLYRSIKVLQEKGYLVEEKNKFNFYETPPGGTD